MPYKPVGSHKASSSDTVFAIITLSLLCYIICHLLLAGVDYDATPLTATFKTGETSVTVTIPVVDDRVVNEEDEEFSVTLSILPATGVRVELGDVSSATGIIEDTSKEHYY